jgi:hypothetical protein
MSTDFYSFEWIGTFSGVVDNEIEGESPTYRRVTLATEDKADALVSLLNLMGCKLTRLTPTVVILEPPD